MSPVPSSEGVSWTGIGSALALSGTAVFGSYPVGEPFDPLTLALSFASNPVVDDPSPPVAEPPAVEPPRAKPPRIVAGARNAKLGPRGIARVGRSAVRPAARPAGSPPSGRSA